MSGEAATPTSNRYVRIRLLDDETESTGIVRIAFSEPLTKAESEIDLYVYGSVGYDADPDLDTKVLSAILEGLLSPSENLLRVVITEQYVLMLDYINPTSSTAEIAVARIKSALEKKGMEVAS